MIRNRISTFLSDGISACFFPAIFFLHPKIRPIMNIYSLYTESFEVVFRILDSNILWKTKNFLQMTKEMNIIILRGNKIMERWGRINCGVGVFSRCAPRKLRNWWHEERTFGWRSMHNSGFAGIRNGRVNARQELNHWITHISCVFRYCKVSDRLILHR